MLAAPVPDPPLGEQQVSITWSLTHVLEEKIPSALWTLDRRAASGLGKRPTASRSPQSGSGKRRGHGHAVRGHGVPRGARPMD